MKNQIQISEISVSNYKKILQAIQQEISQTQKNIFNSVTRKKVEMAWRIGKIIDYNLSQESEKTYGKSLIKKLEKDLKIGESALYKMRNFYKSYPKIPQDDERLNWTHYRILSGIKKDSERAKLENLVKQNLLDSNQLQQEVKQTRIAQIRENKAKKPQTTKNSATQNKITAQRGRLFSYKIKKIAGSQKYCLDLGFGVFREITETLPNALRKAEQIVCVEKVGEKFLLKKSAALAKQIYTYKAYLEKLVDGDTIRVNIDLGFGIFHHEILRLAKINAPEISTSAGKKSAGAIAKILKNTPFLVVKSFQTDIYGRYIAEVFLGKKNCTAEEISNKGIYLNQLLLEGGFAEKF